MFKKAWIPPQMFCFSSSFPSIFQDYIKIIDLFINKNIISRRLKSHLAMFDAIQVNGSIYFATLQWYIIFETDLYDIKCNRFRVIHPNKKQKSKLLPTSVMAFRNGAL